MKKKLITFLIVLMISVLLIPLNIYAKMDTNINISSAAAKTSEDIIKRVLGTLQVIGTVISVIALIIIGIRYMISSTEEKANMKGVIGYYVIGAVLVFATSNVVGFAYDVISSLEK